MADDFSDHGDEPQPALLLRSELYFPSFELLTNEHDPSTDVYEGWETGMLRPRIHWAFIGQIEKIESFTRIRPWVRDRAGELVPIAFYPNNDEKPTTFKWSDLKKGHTICILYAEQHPFMDGTLGIRVETLKNVKVFPGCLDTFMQLSDDYDAYTQRKADQQCFLAECRAKHGTAPYASKTCSRCHMAMYCSVECQQADWKQHKPHCSLLPSFDELASRDFSYFGDYEPFAPAIEKKS